MFISRISERRTYLELSTLIVSVPAKKGFLYKCKAIVSKLVLVFECHLVNYIPYLEGQIIFYLGAKACHMIYDLL